MKKMVLGYILGVAMKNQTDLLKTFSLLLETVLWLVALLLGLKLQKVTADDHISSPIDLGLCRNALKFPDVDIIVQEGGFPTEVLFDEMIEIPDMSIGDGIIDG